MNLRQFLAIVEIRTKIVSLSTYALATVYLVYRGKALDGVNAILMLLAMLFVDMGTTGFNSYFDHKSGVDSARHNREESKVVVHEGVSASAALGVSIALFLAALPLGAFLAWRAGWLVLVAGVIGMGIGYFYTGGPWPISSTAFGEFFAGGALGPLLFWTVWYVHAGFPDWPTFFAALPSTLAIASILTVNNTCDIVGDSDAGRRTLSIRFGSTMGRRLAEAEALGAFLLASVLGLFRIFPIWTFALMMVGAAAAFVELRGMGKQGYHHETKALAMGGISRIFLIYTLALSITLLAGRWIPYRNA